MDWNERTRAFVCFGASVLAHALVIVGLVVRPPSGPVAASGVIEARLEGVPEASEEAQATVQPPPDSPSHAPRIVASARVADPPEPAERLPASEAAAAATAEAVEADRDALRPEFESVAAVDDTWYPARQLDVLPVALVEVEPAYPEAAAAASIGGEVTLLLHVDEMGRIRERSVVESDPPGVFDHAALAAFREVLFQPALRDGRRVRSRVLVTVSFNPDSVEPDAPLSEPADPQ